jgi:carbonic anhydrase
MREERLRFLSRMVLLWLPAGLAAAQSMDQQRTYVSPWRTPWKYEASDKWAELDAQYAACNGKAQSPVDIARPEKAALPPLQFEYHAGPINYVINNGATIRVNYYAPGSEDYLTVGDKRYELTQFHFHHPSEETIDGKPYDMVVHLMHQASDGEVAGVAVLVKIGKANPAITKLWSNMPNTEGQQEVPDLVLSPAAFLPEALSYYTYVGSQTAPPCTEGVRWFILKTPVEMSKKQIRQFAKLFPHDVRPVQPLNGRVVQESD